MSVRRLRPDRKSTCLNSSHPSISYAVFCLKKKKRLLTRKPTKKHNKTIHTQTDAVGKRLYTEEYLQIAQWVSEVAEARGLFFFNVTSTTEIYTLSLHDALPI